MPRVTTAGRNASKPSVFLNSDVIFVFALERQGYYATMLKPSGPADFQLPVLVNMSMMTAIAFFKSSDKFLRAQALNMRAVHAPTLYIRP